MTRRILITLVLAPLGWLALAIGYLAWLHNHGQLPPLNDLTLGDLWMNWLKWPTLLLVGALGVGTAYAWDAGRKADETQRRADEAPRQQQQAEAAAHESETARQRFAAQVVGLQWLNPLQRRDYPTEWQLLWTLGLTGPNADDDMVRKEPEKWSTIRPVAGIAFNFGGQSFRGFYKAYLKKISLTLREQYYMSPHYFYSVAKGVSPWRELAGIRIELALPTALDATEGTDFVRETITHHYAIGEAGLSTSATPPDVRLTQGEHSAGFTSLSAALDYLEDHPDKTVWVMSFDAPSFPKDEQLNETATLLVLAGPGFKTGREPLAWIHRPSRASEKNAATAWRTAFTEAAARGALDPNAVGYLIHDAGQNSDAASRRIGALAQAATETRPDQPFLDTSFNTPALLGDLGTGTALTNLALAVAYAHHKNTPVIVAGTSESIATAGAEPAVTAVLVRPPAKPTPFNPSKTWFRARGEGYAYLPWWGRRHDAKNPMQGWSD